MMALVLSSVPSDGNTTTVASLDILNMLNLANKYDYNHILLRRLMLIKGFTITKDQPLLHLAEVVFSGLLLGKFRILIVVSFALLELLYSSPIGIDFDTLAKFTAVLYHYLSLYFEKQYHFDY